jgi:16S rRNA processing protein RimM
MQPGLQPSAGLTPSSLPDDAIEVGRILDAWGVKGWVKILPHSTDPEALFAAKSWFLQAPDAKFRPGFTVFSGTVTLSVDEAKVHSDSVVAKFTGLDDRNAAEALRGARIFLPRSSFPAASKDEYYWVDLIGLNVVNREGVALGQVRDLMATGPHSVLCVEYTTQQEDGASVTAERMIPFVSVYVDTVDIAGKCITVDWQPDY